VIISIGLGLFLPIRAVYEGGHAVWAGSPVDGARDRPELSFSEEAGSLAGRTTLRVYGGSDKGPSWDPHLSADGRYVAFVSDADDLVYDDTNDSSDIFVHDRDTVKTTRVSLSSSGGEGNDLSAISSISGDGDYVAFGSYASNLIGGDTNGYADIFVHDWESEATARVSVAYDGSEGDGLSAISSISSNGRYVALESSASNLVSGDTNGTIDVFVHDRSSRRIARVSVASDGSQADGESLDPSISATGSYVAFESFASNLVEGDTNGTMDIFVHARGSGDTTRVSLASDGAQADGQSWDPSISATGRYVAFRSDAYNLVEGDTNSAVDIFVHDRQTGETTRVSLASDGTQANQDSTACAISADGRYVAFASYASNLVSGDTNGASDVFVHDRQTGETTRVSIASDSSQANQASGGSSISADGRYVAFWSCASNLVVDDVNGYTDVFVHDRQTGETTRVSIPSGGS
jgi:Tol biopolymer transport system component